MRVVWSSGYDTARVLFEAEHRGKVIRSETSPAGGTQATFELPVTEAMRGGFTIHTLMVRDNRAYLQSHRIDVPWTNKELDIRWERFTSKLEPAASEKWTAVISGKDAEKAAAEMVATLYDASLDAFVPHPWSSGFGIFRQDQSMLSQAFENRLKGLNPVWHSWRIESRDDSLNYPRLDWPPGQGHPDMMYRRGRNMLGRGMPMAMEAMPMAAGAPAPAPAAMAADADFGGMGGMGGGAILAKNAMAEGEAAGMGEGAAPTSKGSPPAPTSTKPPSFFPTSSPGLMASSAWNSPCPKPSPGGTSAASLTIPTSAPGSSLTAS
jgi:hypothetical protein